MEPIERAIQAGVPVVRFGAGTLDGKRRRGARIEDTTSVLLRAEPADLTTT